MIQLRDGEFTVVNDRGDNFLGGKLIDWKIVEEMLIPAAVRQAPALAGLRRGEPRWFAAVNKLKLAAYTAKIRCPEWTVRASWWSARSRYGPQWTV
ncbi:hypothetical protein NLX83_34435 [Allokutzneria sp. A3M-2-11 16]|uniref:hypothetical protein n=1 Tax=Allokutzneria sp. A3M-2-11 16 TaxID=2962043 RepID=UPI0020B7268F|nr:hypothetical protein [Allokutzneria sp. A3M-2-11 16]MCP3804378.1 hypothetical protein [Allokutzneria sp. A3M-2-11 16]